MFGNSVRYFFLVLKNVTVYVSLKPDIEDRNGLMLAILLRK